MADDELRKIDEGENNAVESMNNDLKFMCDLTESICVGIHNASLLLRSNIIYPPNPEGRTPFEYDILRNKIAVRFVRDGHYRAMNLGKKEYDEKELLDKIRSLLDLDGKFFRLLGILDLLLYNERLVESRANEVLKFLKGVDRKNFNSLKGRETNSGFAFLKRDEQYAIQICLGIRRFINILKRKIEEMRENLRKERAAMGGFYKERIDPFEGQALMEKLENADIAMYQILKRTVAFQSSIKYLQQDIVDEFKND